MQNEKWNSVRKGNIPLNTCFLLETKWSDFPADVGKWDGTKWIDKNGKEVPSVVFYQKLNIRKHTIKITKSDVTKSYTTLVAACNDNEDFSYHYIKKNKFPFPYKGWLFEKK